MSETTVAECHDREPDGVCAGRKRPGPATGLPTWTAQGGLLQAACCSAGEFTRCVIFGQQQPGCLRFDAGRNSIWQSSIKSVSLSSTDKQIAEALYTQTTLTIWKKGRN